MLLSISKQTFTKLPGQLIPMTGFRSAIVSHPQIKLNQAPLLDKKSAPSQTLCKFSKSFSVSLPNSYQHESIEAKGTGIRNQQAYK